MLLDLTKAGLHIELHTQQKDTFSPILQVCVEPEIEVTHKVLLWLVSEVYQTSTSA